MRSTAIALSAAFVLSLTSVTAAQEPAANRAAPAPAAAQPAEVDVNQLPVDLSRIQRRLRTEASRQSQDGLNLRFFVDVYALAPPLVLITKEESLDRRPLPSSAPTHQDMLRFLTPRGLAAPPTGRIR